MVRQKTFHDEQFPVGLLTAPSLKPLILAYYQAARFADDIADNPWLSPEQKQKKLLAVRQAFLQPDTGSDLLVIRGLGRLFAAERLDTSLFLDLLTAFERDAAGHPVRIWEELLDYCRYSAAPVGRFMLAIHNENPSGYLPAENLCAILQILNHLNSLKEDLSLLGRCYIPADIMQKYGVRTGDLGLSYTTPQVKALLAEVIARVEALQADVLILPSLVKSFRLRFEIGVILSLTNSMIQKNKKADILQSPPSLGIWDWLKALASGFRRAVFCKYTGQGRAI